MIFSISFRALLEPPADGDLEQSSGSEFPRFLPGFIFPPSPFSVSEQSVLATLLKVSQSHFEAPSGPFLVRSKAGPTHLWRKGNIVFHAITFSVDYWVHLTHQIPVKAWLMFQRHLRSQAVSLTGTMVGFPVENVSVPYSMKESQSNGVSENSD